MKVGDRFPVTVQGIEIAQAVVTYVDVDRVTLEVPGTRAVVGIATSLVNTSPEPEGTKDQIIVTDAPNGTVSPAVNNVQEVTNNAAATQQTAQQSAPVVEDNLREGATVDEPVEPKEETTATETQKENGESTNT